MIKNNRFCLLLIYLSVLIFSCKSAAKNNSITTCAGLLTENEISRLAPNRLKNHTGEEHNQLENISELIIKVTRGSSEFEVFYNRWSDDSLIVDIFGIENQQQIDKITCSLLNYNEIQLPQQTILLFYRYGNNTDNYKVIAGLKRKK